jgi:hypothetical protein
MYSDGNRLYLAIDRNGRKRWIFRFARNGKQRDVGLGSPLDVTLAEARAAADKANALLRQNIDPLEHKRQVAAARAMPGFGEYVETFLAVKERGWQNAKHRAQWRMTLTKYAAPLHVMPLDKITASDVLKVLQPLWQAKPETASRLRGRIEAVLCPYATPCQRARARAYCPRDGISCAPRRLGGEPRGGRAFPRLRSAEPRMDMSARRLQSLCPANEARGSPVSYASPSRISTCDKACSAT